MSSVFRLLHNERYQNQTKMKNKIPPAQQAKNVVKWLRAIASGKYNKTVSVLRLESDSSYKYCCLGVACEIFKLDPKFREAGYRALPGTIGLIDGLGVADKPNEFPIEGASGLARLNDNQYRDDKNFKRVHKAIVKHYRRLLQPEVAAHLVPTVKGDSLRVVPAKTKKK